MQQYRFIVGRSSILVYYTCVSLVCWLVLFVLSILVWENDRLCAEEKRLLFVAYGLVALASFVEWLGLQLNGNTDLPLWPLRVVKCADYILTPIAGGFIVLQHRSRSIWVRLLLCVLGINALFQLIAAFTGWMVIFDTQNRYSHGPLYSVYVVLYILMITLVIIEYIHYGKRFRRQNQISLYAILLVIAAGIIMQEVLGGENRTVYLTMTFGMVLLFIHDSEFAQLAADDTMQEQQILITTDALTGVSSRYAYAKALKALDSKGELPPRLTVFSIDINGLKEANDTLDHSAGDELICAAAKCIDDAFGSDASCYRTGGDEFIVLAEMDKAQAEQTMEKLERLTEAWHGEKVESLHLAAGYAMSCDHPGLSAEKLVVAADQSMYASKEEYYRKAGIDRRRR